MNDNEYQNKVKELIKAVVDNPYESENYLTLAGVYLQNNDYEPAVNIYESLLNFEPENFIALTNLGSIYLSLIHI